MVDVIVTKEEINQTYNFINPRYFLPARFLTIKNYIPLKFLRMTWIIFSTNIIKQHFSSCYSDIKLKFLQHFPDMKILLLESVEPKGIQFDVIFHQTKQDEKTSDIAGSIFMLPNKNIHPVQNPNLCSMFFSLYKYFLCPC